MASFTRCNPSADCASCSYIIAPARKQRALRLVAVYCHPGLPGLPVELPPRPFDIVGLGQAMVDFSGVVDDCFLRSKALVKGGRRVITVAERAALIEELNASGFTLNAGGSLANTLAGCAVLGRAAYAQQAPFLRASRPLRIGLGGCIGDDHLGSFFRSQLSSAGVDWISPPAPGTGTGTVVVLTSPDAQRSFLSYPGTSNEVAVAGVTEAAIRASRILVIEGYLWEFPNARESIQRAISIARDAGTIVALTMADASVVLRHRSEMLAALQGGADILFTNASEAAALLGEEEATSFSAREAALKLGVLCPVAVVTDGSKGSFITALGDLHVIPPHWTPHGPVDTCGAGDAYAAGLLFGYLSGLDLWQMGELAAHTAASVISHQGPQLSQRQAEQLIVAHGSRKRQLARRPPFAGKAAAVAGEADALYDEAVVHRWDLSI